MQSQSDAVTQCGRGPARRHWGLPFNVMIRLPLSAATLIILCTGTGLTAQEEQESRRLFTVAAESGETVTGYLEGLSDDEVLIRTRGDEERRFSLQAVERITGSDGLAPTDTEQEVLLTTGGRLVVNSVTLAGQKFGVVGRWMGGAAVSPEQVRAVRLKPLTEGLEGEWTAFLQRENSSDLLVVPRREGGGLDFLSGTVSGISAEAVSFLLDGDTIPVPPARVFGVVFRRRDGGGVARSAVRLESDFGDLLTGRLVSADSREIRLAPAGMSTEIAVRTDATRLIDFSSGRSVYLSELEPVEVNFGGIDPPGSVFAGLMDAETERIQFSPRKDSVFEYRQPIRLGGKQYQRGWCIHSRTRMIFGLDGRYSRLTAVVGIDDFVRTGLEREALLKLEGDGQVLFEQPLRTTDDPMDLSLDLSGIRTLTVTVDYGDQDSFCDWVDLADARLAIVQE